MCKLVVNCKVRVTLQATVRFKEATSKIVFFCEA